MELTVDTILKEKFPDFEPALRQYLMEKGSLREVEEGDELIRQGQFIRSAMLVLEGQIKVHRAGEEGREIFLYFLDAGDSCAVSMICGGQNQPGYLHAVASEKSLLLILPLETMPELMAKFKSWYTFVIQTYRKRFEELLEVTDNVAFKSMDERLEFYLKKISKENGTKDIKATHEQIANDLATSRVVISRLLKKMEEDGKLRLGRNSIELA